MKGTTFGFSDRVTGSVLAELLLGRAASAANTGTWKLFGRMDNYSASFRMNWKMNGRLTLNLGLRWEVETPRFDARNELSGLDLRSHQSGLQLSGCGDICGSRWAQQIRQRLRLEQLWSTVRIRLEVAAERLGCPRRVWHPLQSLVP